MLTTGAHASSLLADTRQKEANAQLALKQAEVLMDKGRQSGYLTSLRSSGVAATFTRKAVNEVAVLDIISLTTKR